MPHLPTNQQTTPRERWRRTFSALRREGLDACAWLPLDEALVALCALVSRSVGDELATRAFVAHFLHRSIRPEPLDLRVMQRTRRLHVAHMRRHYGEAAAILEARVDAEGAV